MFEGGMSYSQIDNTNFPTIRGSVYSYKFKFDPHNESLQINFVGIFT